MAAAQAQSQANVLHIAAAADLKFAMDELLADYYKGAALQSLAPRDKITVAYGSSGKFHTQIRQGAPYDMFFSADIAYAQSLAKMGLASSPVIPYATGRLVLWSKQVDARFLSLQNLAAAHIRRVAIANPQHAPYGRRAKEALQATGAWKQIEHKLVLGENIAQAAQFVQSGNAEVGIIALSLAMSPTLQKTGSYQLIDESLHAPLLQGFIVTQRAQKKPAAQRFAQYMQGASASRILQRYGFSVPSREALKP